MNTEKVHRWVLDGADACMPLILASDHRGITAKELGFRIQKSATSVCEVLRYLARCGMVAKCGGGCRTAWIDTARAPALAAMLHSQNVAKVAAAERRSLGGAERRIASQLAARRARRTGQERTGK